MTRLRVYTRRRRPEDFEVDEDRLQHAVTTIRRGLTPVLDYFVIVALREGNLIEILWPCPNTPTS